MQTVDIEKIFEESKKSFNENKYKDILNWITYASDKDYINIAEKYGVIFIQSLLSDMEKYFNNKAQEKINILGNVGDKNHEIIEDELKASINSIVRFRNGATLNLIAEKLLREGGFIRGTREFLTKDVLKRREMFANSLIGVYDAVESEKEYKERAENEKTDIDEVINALYYNRFENFLKNIEIDEQDELEKVKVVRMSHILKMAKLISDTLKKDYFTNFLCIPDVNVLMKAFEKDETGYLKDCINRCQTRIKKVIYPETEAENGKYQEYILGNEQTEEGRDIKIKVMMLNDEFLDKALK